MSQQLVEYIRQLVGHGKWPYVARGATVTVNGDKSILYERWKVYRRGALASFRVSTHFEMSLRGIHVSLRHPQYEVSGLTVAGRPGVLLAGVTADGDTFFKFEWHSGTIAHPGEAAKHIVDLGHSKWSGGDIGPGGVAPHCQSISVEFPG